MTRVMQQNYNISHIKCEHFSPIILARQNETGPREMRLSPCRDR